MTRPMFCAFVLTSTILLGAPLTGCGGGSSDGDAAISGSSTSAAVDTTIGTLSTLSSDAVQTTQLTPLNPADGASLRATAEANGDIGDSGSGASDGGIATIAESTQGLLLNLANRSASVPATETVESETLGASGAVVATADVTTASLKTENLQTTEPTVQAQAAAKTTSVQAVRISSPDSYRVPPPDLASLRPFEAVPPYFVQTKGGIKRVKLGIYGTWEDVRRGFDFVQPIINPQTNRTNALTLQMPVVTDSGIKYVNVSDASVPKASNNIPGKRIDYQNGQLKVAYIANDPPSSEKLRTMINSWPIPTRTTLTWDLSFKLGGATAAEAWPKTKPTQSPTLLWQVKADPGFPSMGFFVDTSSEDQSKIQLTFFQRTSNQSFNDFRWVVPDLPRDQPIDVVIQANLDDRDEPENQGTLRVWVNGRLIADKIGRNLVQGIADPHRWAFGVYLTSESNPINQSRVTLWKRARMLVSD